MFIPFQLQHFLSDGHVNAQFFDGIKFPSSKSNVTVIVLWRKAHPLFWTIESKCHSQRASNKLTNYCSDTNYGDENFENLKQIEAGDRVSIKQYIKWLQSGARILISKVNTIKGFYVSGWKQHVVARMDGPSCRKNIQMVYKMFRNFQDTRNVNTSKTVILAYMCLRARTSDRV